MDCFWRAFLGWFRIFLIYYSTRRPEQFPSFIYAVAWNLTLKVVSSNLGKGKSFFLYIWDKVWRWWRALWRANQVIEELYEDHMKISWVILFIDNAGFFGRLVKPPQSRPKGSPHMDGPFLTRISRVVSYTTPPDDRSSFLHLPTPWHEIPFHRTSTTIVKLPSRCQVIIWPHFWL